MTETLTALGDSQTDYAGYGVPPSKTWTYRLAEEIRARGGDVRSRAFGIQGDQTLAGLNRVDVCLMYDTPALALLPLGVNDPVASPSALTSAQTIDYITATIMALRHGATGPGAGLGQGVHVAGQANLPATGGLGQRYVVLDDTSTTGGRAATSPGHAATITGSVAADANGNKVTVWEFRQTQAGEFGWGRVAVRTSPPTVVPRCAVITPPYRNFTTGGDTPSTPLAINATLRAAQESAASVFDASVAFLDVYARMRQRIVDGVDLDFSAVAYNQARSWTYIENNQHLSTYGHDAFAQGVLAELIADRPTWLTNLGATL
ncbi:hypothetical protein KNU62_gp38 [Gordonia phage Bakery]|uniref:SGNH hydrolase-type esterase domain-containing protein n=1 Tax=Gordonia phage Bakery TaxID=2591205 RepID=A0A514DGU2_9CAUD|nr:hypothetical protein KNU62_gp38 [Gordonia phage Bakery]QDH92823.1 hypothetical protein SEA_BAKERY_38 [Gordonia phage Bakery]